MPTYRGVLKKGQKWVTGEGSYSRTILRIDTEPGRDLIHYQTDDDGLFWTDEHEFRAWCGGAQVVAEVSTGVDTEGPIVLMAEVCATINGEWHVSLQGNRKIWSAAFSLDCAVQDWVRSHSHYYGGDSEAVVRRLQVAFDLSAAQTLRRLVPR